MHNYTKAQVQFLRKKVTGRSYAELTRIFNKHFGLNLSLAQIKGTLKRYKLRNGLVGRFQPGQISHNKGKKGFGGWEPTQFKKGHKPWNYKPVGSERVNADGYVEVKIADPKTWKGKHLVIWEKANGPVPEGYVIIFADGNQLNVTLDNLLFVSRKKLAVINKRGLISNNPELTKSGVIIADICLKIGERKRNRTKK